MNSPTLYPVELQSDQWNPGVGRSALLVHGLAASSGTWWRVASGLGSAGFQVTAPNLRGHGPSPRTVTYSFDEHCEDLSLLGGPWDIAIGHSLAGPILTRLAERGLVNRLLLLDPVMEIADESFDALVDGQVAELDPSITVDGLSASNPRWHVQDAFQKVADARAVSSFIIERCLRDNFPYQHLAGLAGLEVSTLILGADPAVGMMCDAATIDALGNPRVEHRVVAGAGHGIHREQPETVIDAAISLFG